MVPRRDLRMAGPCDVAFAPLTRRKWWWLIYSNKAVSHRIDRLHRGRQTISMDDLSDLTLAQANARSVL